MGNVISLSEYRYKHGYVSGDAVCMECGEQWVAVAMAGGRWLECPECGSMKGHFKFHFAPDDMVLTCGCANQLLMKTMSGLFCPNCGCEVEG